MPCYFVLKIADSSTLALWHSCSFNICFLPSASELSCFRTKCRERVKDWSLYSKVSNWGELLWTSSTYLSKQPLFFTRILTIIDLLCVYYFPMRLNIAFPHGLCSCSSYGDVPERISGLLAPWESGQTMRKFCLPPFPASSQNTPNTSSLRHCFPPSFSLFSVSTASALQVLMSEGNMITK